MERTGRNNVIFITMSKVSAKKRRIAIAQKRKKYQKLKKLREKYLASKSSTDREVVLAKICEIAPHLCTDEYLAEK